MSESQGWTSVRCWSVAPTIPPTECLLWHFIAYCATYLAFVTNTGAHKGGVNQQDATQQETLRSSRCHHFTLKCGLSPSLAFPLSLTRLLTRLLTRFLSAHHFILKYALSHSVVGGPDKLYRERYSTGTVFEGSLQSCRVLIKGTLVDNPFV